MGMTTLNSDANRTANAAELAETLINRNATETALKDNVNSYVDQVIGYAQQYTDWAVTSVSCSKQS